MKTHLKLLAVLTVVFWQSMALAQPVVPAESPSAVVEQRLGFNNIKITYARPAVKGRKVWGSLVPYDQVWRTGADWPTFITLADTTIIEGKHTVPPGKYALYTIPKKDKWTIILSANTKLWGAFGYTDSADVLRVDVEPKACEHTESFTISFSDPTETSATLSLQWEKLRVPVRLQVNIVNKVISGVKAVLADTAKARYRSFYYWQGANFLLKENVHTDLAMQWVDSSLSLDKDWRSLWTKAGLLALKGNFTDALTYGKQALELVEKDEAFSVYTAAFRDEINTWEKQSGDKPKRGGGKGKK